MGKGARVLVAMSGGVDSSVAAARLVDAGREAIGVTLHLWDYPTGASSKSRCCAPEDVHQARLAADFLGIPHYTFDRRELFAEAVVAPFVADYLRGKTPSPCVSCNRSVKMRELFLLADRLGAAAVATGHYARRGRDPQGRAALLAGKDARKDQSYFLHMLSAAQLERVCFPLGDSRKEEVRAEAKARGLPGADKGESQELCFVPDGDYSGFVERRSAGRLRPGPIVDPQGRVLGQHAGVHRFTVGQRRGLGIALGRPAFVTAIDGDRVVVGDEPLAKSASLVDPCWAEGLSFPLRAGVKVRSQHRAAPAVIDRGQGGFIVTFDAPVRAVAPGQVAVAYADDRVLGGGVIAEAS